MAYAMTKQGSLDNCITYEFICDTLEDMNAIENRYRTLGSVAVVLQGESGGMEAYITGSNKQWNNLGAMGANGSSSESAGGGLSIYICAQNEVSNGLPNIQDPDETTIYLVSAGNESGNLYEEYIYVNSAWEKFGASSIDLSGYAPIANPVFTGSMSLGRKLNTTVGTESFAFGYNVTASGNQSHAEGSDTIASGSISHAEGVSTIASGAQSHAEGLGGTFTLNNVEYTSEAKGVADHTEGYQCRTTSGQPGNHAEGFLTSATGGASHSEGYCTLASGTHSHAEGNTTTASGSQSHTEGDNTKATGWGSHAEGISTTASNQAAHAEGQSTTASGSNSHAEGESTIASGEGSHAEGSDTVAFAIYSHAEGAGTNATGMGSHAEGANTISSGNYSHAEGDTTQASGIESHAEGSSTLASGKYSHVEGHYTTARGLSEHVSGQYNVLDSAPAWVASKAYVIGNLVFKEKSFTDASGMSRPRTIIYRCKENHSGSTFNESKWEEYGQYLVIVGNGTANNNRSNAYVLDWNGNGKFKGDLYIGCNADSTGGSAVGARIAALEAEVASLRDALAALTPTPQNALALEDNTVLTDENNEILGTDESVT